MLVPISMILTSQLIIAVADNVPKFDIFRGCRVDSASAFNPNAGLNATIKRCMDDEQQAKDRPQTTGETVGEKSDDNSTPPSYVELLTCLQDQQFARKLPKN
jgi:hypothetical protein